MSVIPWPLEPVRGGGCRSTGALKHAMIEHMPSADDTAGLAAALIQSRQTILPKRLGAPGPNVAELAAILQAAAHAPDHGQLTPWRFVLVPYTSRTLLADVFAEALLERDLDAAPEQLEQAREKAYRSPVLLLAIVDGERGDADIELAERMVSAGCAIQNMLLMATAQGYGSALTSGKALQSAPLRSLFRLLPTEQALCFVSIGTPTGRKTPRLRPLPAEVLTTLEVPQ